MSAEILNRLSEQLKTCRCGKIPEIVESWDTLQVVCECGEKSGLFFGYCNEDMSVVVTYGQKVVNDWNRRVNNEKH